MLKTSWTRRDILRLFGGTAIASHVGASRATAARSDPSTRPRYYVLANLDGGFDAIYCTDPKQRREVESWVDLPYSKDAIVSRGDVRLGPHFAPLLAHTHEIAFLNGVDVGTANHDTGHLQAARLRTRVKPAMPTILDILGAHRDGQPLGCLSLGAVTPAAYSSGWFGTMSAGLLPPVGNETMESRNDLLDEIASNDPLDMQRIARSLRAQAGRLGRTSRTTEGQTTAERMQQAAALLERLPSCPTFRPARWSRQRERQALAVQFQRLLWALENDLTRTVHLGVPGYWDSHVDNAMHQAEASGNFSDMFTRFLEELASRRNAFGPLAQQTAIVAGSELGRFPRLNSNRGKDHLSQTPYFFVGPAFRCGKVYGSTGSMLESIPVSIDKGGRGGLERIVPTLDDVGATLLHIAGLKPELYGYDGRVLRFLVAT